ncbi:MAG: hypothetical protein GYA24_19570 [Candidatus Lokiarchaeota archaeon]|nr:hypothetical protein [Candidatus Lokiarchaeota archaeon]
MPGNDQPLARDSKRVQPLLSFASLVCLNILAFFPVHVLVRSGLLCIVSIVAIRARLRWNEISGILLFLIVNLAWMILIFYFVSFDWFVSARLFIDYALLAFILTIGTCVFWKVTPARDLAVALGTIKVPRSFALAIVVGTMFLPFLARSLKEITIMQQARGVKRSSFKLVSIVIPAILRILDLSVDMSLSMQSRGHVS